MSPERAPVQSSSMPPGDMSERRRAEDDLRRRLARVHLQLAQRDDEIQRLLSHDQELERLRSELERAQREGRQAREQLEAVRSTRAWRSAVMLWKLRSRLLGR
jgi:chromosome segregation ATPase